MVYFREVNLDWLGRGSLAVAFGLVAFVQTVEAAAERPNILFIMADDLGWMDLACQGNKLVETPNIDRLARQGMRFTSAYAAEPVCSPTRAAVLTGQAPARVHMTSHLPGQFFPKDNRPQPADMVPAIGPEHITIAERLKEVGYANAFLGKWHIAPSAGPRGKVAPGHSPLGQGFDINIGGTSYGGPPSFFSPYSNATLPDGEPGEYLPDRIVNEAISFIRDHKAEPWMVHLWFYTVHWPMQAPKELLKKYANRTGPGLNDTRYGAMIEAMDLAVGRLLASLEELGLDDETLVVFTSDNGGFAGVSDCRPLRESKGHLYEGGIRVPMIVRWPGQVPAGKVYGKMVSSTDVYPTLLATAGLRMPGGQPADGVDLLPFINGKNKSKPHEWLCWQNRSWLPRKKGGFVTPTPKVHNSAIRKGNWKLVRLNEKIGSDTPPPAWQLYDLEKDIGERQNVADQNKDVVNELNAHFDSWRSTMHPTLE